MKLFCLVIAFVLVVSSANVVRLNEDNFKQEIALSGKGDKWFIQFTAPWCSKCKKTITMWNEVEKVLVGKASLGLIDGSLNPSLVRDFDVKTYPTFIFIKGNKYTKYEGAQVKEAFNEFASETYKYNEFTKIPEMPNSLLLYLDNLTSYAKKQLDTNPLVVSGFMLGIGIIIGIGLGILAHIILKEPQDIEKKDQ